MGLAALVPGLACGTGDSSVFAGAVAEQPTATPVPSPTPVPTPTPEQPVPTSTAAPTAVPDRAVAGDLVVEFTYTQAAGGKNERPYIAVWVEDADANLVQTISLWYEQGRRGERWLDHLTQWYAADQASAAADTVSSATRSAGSYAVAWDGLVAGEPTPVGDYRVFVESAREDGPYSLTSASVSLAGSLSPLNLPDDGELSQVSVRIDA